MYPHSLADYSSDFEEREGITDLICPYAPGNLILCHISLFINYFRVFLTNTMFRFPVNHIILSCHPVYEASVFVFVLLEITVICNS